MQGRLNRESNPVPGEKPGFTPQHKATDGSFVDTGVSNPLPTKDSGVAQKLDELKAATQKVTITNPQTEIRVNNFPANQNVKDADVEAELTLSKQQNASNDNAILAKLASLEAKIQATNDKLNGTLSTQLTGSIVAESTKPKPAGKMGNTLFLWDTRQVFLHDGTEWREV